MKKFLEGFGIITFFIGCGAGDSQCIWVAPLIIAVGIIAYRFSKRFS